LRERVKYEYDIATDGEEFKNISDDIHQHQ